MALNLTTWSDEIVICTNGAPADLDETEYVDKLDEANIPVLTEPIARMLCEGREISSLEFETGLHLDVDKVFFTLAQYPADQETV